MYMYFTEHADVMWRHYVQELQNEPTRRSQQQQQQALVDRLEICLICGDRASGSARDQSHLWGSRLR